MEECENSEKGIISIERFTKGRYEWYKRKGVEFRVVNGYGRLCEVKAFDCGEKKDQVYVESHYEWCGEEKIKGYRASQRSGGAYMADPASKLYICRGPWFEKHALVVKTVDGVQGREIFMWGGLRPATGVQGEYLAKWSIVSPYDDMRNSQFNGGTCSYRLRQKAQDGKIETVRFRAATDRDIDDYSRALRDHRIAWEDDGNFYHYPHVGDKYYEIYFNHGKADFRQHVLVSESERPEVSRLIMPCDGNLPKEQRELPVREVVAKINKALGLEE